MIKAPGLTGQQLSHNSSQSNMATNIDADTLSITTIDASSIRTHVACSELRLYAKADDLFCSEAAILKISDRC